MGRGSSSKLRLGCCICCAESKAWTILNEACKLELSDARLWSVIIKRPFAFAFLLEGSRKLTSECRVGSTLHEFDPVLEKYNVHT